MINQEMHAALTRLYERNIDRKKIIKEVTALAKKIRVNEGAPLPMDAALAAYIVRESNRGILPSALYEQLETALEAWLNTNTDPKVATIIGHLDNNI